MHADQEDVYKRGKTTHYMYSLLAIVIEGFVNGCHLGNGLTIAYSCWLVWTA